MDVYIYRTDEGEYLRLLGVTDRIARYDIERLLCGGDRLEAVFVTNSRDAELIKPDRLIERNRISISSWAIPGVIR